MIESGASGLVPFSFFWLEAKVAACGRVVVLEPDGDCKAAARSFVGPAAQAIAAKIEQREQRERNKFYFTRV